MKHILCGKQAEEFTLRNADNEEFHFDPKSEDGKPTALFFYPQSGTYGCTKEACQFNNALKDDEVFKSTNVRVVGISPDPVTKQKKFVAKHNLTYPILSDEKGEVRKKYHVSRGLMGLTASSRVTFVIDQEGIIKDVLDTTVNFAAHHKFVLNWLMGLEKQKKSAEPTSEKREPQEDTPEEDAEGSKPEEKPDNEKVTSSEPSGIAEGATMGVDTSSSALDGEGKEDEVETGESTAATTPTVETQPLIGTGRSMGAETPLVPAEQTIP